MLQITKSYELVPKMIYPLNNAEDNWITDEEPLSKSWERLSRPSTESNGVDTPLRLALVDDFQKNFNYFWAHDRIQCFTQDDFTRLPLKIKKQLIIDYLFRDIFQDNIRFF